jgi:hypothetical protein
MGAIGRGARRVWGALHRPESLLRPHQVIRRLRGRRLVRDDAVRLAWGLPITVHGDCCIGRDVVNLGVFDKVVPEAIARLLDPGEWAVDASANVGQNSAIMALAAGPSGHVLAVEPHPLLVRRLASNVERWRAAGVGSIAIHAVALGPAPGEALLHEPGRVSSRRPNFVETLDPSRLHARYQAPLWRCLRRWRTRRMDT